MNYLVEERALKIADYIVKNKTTVRKTAKEFGISKSTVHKDITERLKKINLLLYHKVKIVMENNKAFRHIHGGQATRIKYLNLHN